MRSWPSRTAITGAIIRAMDETGPPRPAGFWIRAVALAIDLVVFALVQASFAALATVLVGPAVDGIGGQHPSVALFTLLFTAVYMTVLRYLAYYLSLMPLGFGYLVAGLRRDKRALHDLIAGSRVERLPRRRRAVRRPSPARPASGTLQDPAVRHAGDAGLGA